MTESGFTVDVDQNQYLPEGGREVSAVVTVTSAADATGLSGPGSAGAEPDHSAEIIIIDCSGSMEYPHTKIAEARAATAAAVDVVRDGVLFAVIAGTNLAWPVFPADGGMVRADASSRAAARQAVTGLRASGGTAIGQWLELARQTFERYPAKLRHAILLTDGKNQHESPELAAAIQDGLEARKQGDEETATAKLGRAVALAHQSGNEDTAKLLAKVVDVLDVETGTVRLRKQVEDADEMALDTRSTKTVRARK